MSEPQVDHREVEQRRGRKVWWRWLAIAIGVVVLLGAGWGAAMAFQSPSQVAARTVAPPPNAVTAAVTRGDLARTVSLKATVQREHQFAVAFVAGGDQREVVTRVALAPGAELQPAAVAAEINGRPRFAIPGAFPFYRSMTIGDTGPDVKQLQLALAVAGYAVNADGRFGAESADALKRLYTTAGYSIPVASEPQQTPPLTPVPGVEGGEQPPTTQTPALSVPASEFLVFPTLPALLTSTPPVGSLLNDSSAVTISTGTLIAAGEVDAATALMLKPGMKATVQGPDGSPVAATLNTVDEAAAPNKPAATASTDLPANRDTNWTARLAFSQPPPPAWLGVEILGVITINVAATDSLIVPSIAVVSAGEGNPHVLKQLPNGTFKRIPVKEVGLLAGRSAITPNVKDDLQSGDLVKVG